MDVKIQQKWLLCLIKKLWVYVSTQKFADGKVIQGNSFPNYISSSEFFVVIHARIPRQKGHSNLGHIPALPMMEFPMGNNTMLLFVKQMRISYSVKVKSMKRIKQHNLSQSCKLSKLAKFD